MDFLLDVSVAGASSSDEVLRDYCYWFSSSDPVRMTVFASGNSEILELKKSISQYSHPHLRGQSIPKIRWILQRVPFNQLHQYYTRGVLVNEIQPFKPGDLFRLFRFVHPNNRSDRYENQAIAIQFDNRYTKVFKGQHDPYLPAIVDPIVDYLTANPEHSLLEVGCGAGSTFSLIRERFPQPIRSYCGVDQSRYLTIKAIDRFNHIPDVTFQLGDCAALVHGDDTFDVGYAESVLPYVTDPILALQELHRVTRHGFFCSLYTIPGHIKSIPYQKRTHTYPLNTGALWKFIPKPTTHVFHIPSTSSVRKLARNWDSIVVVENDDDQFFGPLGIRTVNFFFYPRQWYLAQSSIKKWCFEVLMQ